MDGAMKENKIVCTSGYFNPLHKGHLALFKAAKNLGERLIVIVNNDEQVKLKGSLPFMDENERQEIVNAIRYVDYAIISIDKDRTVRETLRLIKPDVFIKGGDSTLENIPEKQMCEELGIDLVIGVGGNKIQSSSWLKNIKS